MAEGVEYLWVEKNLPKKPCRILNFGSNQDRSVEPFTERGYTIVGVDLLPDPRAGTIKGYEFHEGDFFNMNFDEKFECIYAIGSVEHVGIQSYGMKIVDPDGDIKVVRKLYDLLKPSGKLLITVPFGGFLRYFEWRVYGKDSLAKLVDGFEHSFEFFVAAGEYFLWGWRGIHGLVASEQPPMELLSEVMITRPITQESANKLVSIACVTITKDEK